MKLSFHSNYVQIEYLRLDIDFTIPSREVQTWLLRLHSFFSRVEK